jgi:16S rRNA (cytidine1402-2'-O)-methyltransferase
MSKLGKLHLIPTLLGETNPEKVVPEEVLEVSRDLIHFIAENEKTARRYLKKAGTRIHLNDLIFYPLNKRTEATEIPQLIKPLLEGTDMGLISEAGLAGIADPGAAVVELCHKKGIQVIPHTGASSIILALIGSGFNGQQFTFHGYLPIDQSERKKAIRSMESVQREREDIPRFSWRHLSEMISFLKNWFKYAIHKHSFLSLEISPPKRSWLRPWKLRIG